MAIPAWFDEYAYLNSKLNQLTSSGETGYTTINQVKTAILNAGFTSTYEHFAAYSLAERTSPNEYFNTNEYLAAKAEQMGGTWTADKVALAFQNAGYTNAYDHFVAWGWQEGVNPSNAFDISLYLESKAAESGLTVDEVTDAFAAAGLDPISHYVLYGQDEAGVTVSEVPASEQVDPDTTSGSAGQTFTLTTGVDTLTGTSGNDTFIADNTNSAASSAADSINGGAGTDTLKIYSKAATANVLPTLSFVEKLWVNAENQGLDISSTTLSEIELNALGAAGKSFAVKDQKVTLSDLATAVTATISGNDSTAQTLSMSKYGTTASAITTLSGTKVAALTLNSTGSLTSTQSNQIIIDNTGSKIATVTLTGDAAVNVTLGNGNAAGFVSTGITSIDASAMTANSTVIMDAGNAAGHADLATSFSYTGGTKNDTLNLSDANVAGAALTAAQLKAMTIKGGDGTDTLVVSNTIATGTTALTNLTNFENIGVFNANGTVNIANFNGVTGIALSGTAGGGVTVNNLGSAAILAQGTSADGGFALAVNAAGTGIADALTWSVGSATAALGANTGTVTINGYETITLTSQGAANTFGAGGLTLASSAGGSETFNVVASKDLTFAGAVTLSGSSTAMNVSGEGAVVVTGVLTTGTLTSTGTGNFTATGANKVLNADFSATTKTISFTDSAAASAAILKGGSGDTTFVGSAFNDVITVGGGTNNVTGGDGADSITINHTAASTATTLTIAAATNSGTATGFAASTAVPTAAFSTTTMDVITGFKAGDKVSLTGVTAAGTLLTNGSTTGAATAGDVILVKGTYNSTANTFTASTSGTDSALVWDDNGTTATGNYDAIILIGYVDSGSADTVAAGPAAVFTAV